MRFDYIHNIKHTLLASNRKKINEIIISAGKVSDTTRNKTLLSERIVYSIVRHKTPKAKNYCVIQVPCHICGMNARDLY